jgi:hypothetical protein
MSAFYFLRAASDAQRVPSPVQTKPRAVPTDYCFWPDDRQGAQQVRRQAIETGKYQPIDAAEGGRLEDFRRRTLS